jgi:hypothetical protein
MKKMSRQNTGPLYVRRVLISYLESCLVSISTIPSEYELLSPFSILLPVIFPFTLVFRLVTLRLRISDNWISSFLSARLAQLAELYLLVSYRSTLTPQLDGTVCHLFQLFHQRTQRLCGWCFIILSNLDTSVVIGYLHLNSFRIRWKNYEISLLTYLLTHSLTHSLHGAGYYLKSW